jgi:hypothetical protein
MPYGLLVFYFARFPGGMCLLQGNGEGSAGRNVLQDVVYYYAPEQDTTVTISLCASAVHSDAFDTKLYVVADLLSAKAGRVDAVACNDDYCGYQSQLQVWPLPLGLWEFLGVGYKL